MDYLIPFWSHTGPACIHVQCTIEYPWLGNFLYPVEKKSIHAFKTLLMWFQVIPVYVCSKVFTCRFWGHFIQQWGKEKFALLWLTWYLNKKQITDNSVLPNRITIVISSNQWNEVRHHMKALTLPTLPCPVLLFVGTPFMYNTETVLFRTALRSWTNQGRWNIFKSSGD